MQKRLLDFKKETHEIEYKFAVSELTWSWGFLLSLDQKTVEEG